MTAAPAKRRLSGFCNPTLPRTDTYDPHQRCHGCDCRATGCPCNPETKMTDATGLDALDPATTTVQRPEEAPPPDVLVSVLATMSTDLDEALAGYSPADWTDAARLLHALRTPIETLRRIDANLTTWIYLHGEHGLHQQIEGIPGRVNITRGRSKERWASPEAVQAYVDAKMEELEGEIPDPAVVVGWVLEAASVGYMRKTALRDAGLDVADFYESLPGNVSVSIG